jgi:hypothetical protein
MRIASSTSQNCGISYFIFDDITSLAGSADAQNVDPLTLSDICEGLKNENPYCTDLSCFSPFTLYPFWTRVRVKGNPYPVITW